MKHVIGILLISAMLLPHCHGMIFIADIVEAERHSAAVAKKIAQGDFSETDDPWFYAIFAAKRGNFETLNTVMAHHDLYPINASEGVSLAHVLWPTRSFDNGGGPMLEKHLIQLLKTILPLMDDATIHKQDKFSNINALGVLTKDYKVAYERGGIFFTDMPFWDEFIRTLLARGVTLIQPDGTSAIDLADKNYHHWLATLLRKHKATVQNSLVN